MKKLVLILVVIYSLLGGRAYSVPDRYTGAHGFPVINYDIGH